MPRTTLLTLEGVRMKVPLRRELDRRVLTSKNEPWMASLFKRILSVKEGALVDVGANAGQTLLRYKSLFPKGIYVGFEPNCYAAAYIQDIIELNRWTDSMVLPVGVGDRRVLASLSLTNPSDLCATFVQESTGNIAKERPTLILTGEEALVLANVHFPAIIKIDVEGFEVEVLRGFASVLESEKPVVICEVLPAAGKKRFLSRNASIEDTLRDYGYWILKAV